MRHSQEQPDPLACEPWEEQQAQAITILGGTGYQRGVELVETGGNCENFDVRYFPEVDEDLQGIGGETFLTARSTLASREINLNAEVNSGSGIAGFGFVTACTVANDVASFGSPAGTILLDEVTESQGRAAWRRLAEKLSSKPLRILS